MAPTRQQDRQQDAMSEAKFIIDDAEEKDDQSAGYISERSYDYQKYELNLER